MVERLGIYDTWRLVRVSIDFAATGRFKVVPAIVALRPVSFRMRRSPRLLFRIALIPSFRRQVKRLFPDSHEKSESNARSCGLPARQDTKTVDQGLGGLDIPKLRLNFDEVPVVFVSRVGGKRRFRRLELLM